MADNMCKFSIDGDPKAGRKNIFKGKDFGERWNGWMIPYVDEVQYKRIVEWCECPETREALEALQPSYGLYAIHVGLCFLPIN